MTAAAPADAAPRRAADQPGRREPTTHQDGSEPRSRGRLVLAEKVIEKIAGQAAVEIGAAWGRSGGVLGIGSEPDPSARPKVDVDLSSDSTDLAISVGIAYPQSIRQATQQIHDHVATRVIELTGVRVHRIDIDVTFLSAADQRPRVDSTNGGHSADDTSRRKELR